MRRECPRKCSKTTSVVRYGSYFRRSDSKRIPRWRCQNCLRTFSAATTNPCFGQNKRRVNHQIYWDANSKVSQRRMSLKHRINRKTVARKIKFLAIKNYKSRIDFLKKCGKSKKLQRLQFDDLVTFEHTKCKPVAISALIDPETRKVLDFEVSTMAAFGKLAKISQKKYGRRRDRRRSAWNKIFRRARNYADDEIHFQSDQHPLYPKIVQKYFPRATHQTFKGRKSCIVGQGELKDGGFDPLFNINHNFAMFRDNIAQLVRRSWCTTKSINSLRRQVENYVHFHNNVLT